ncbi:MAG TPA: hypothetical protein VD994_16745, partial [Prosthecobacter sp.]|nr:hypothetical protein [Prosthecobacter sp.]
MPAVQAAKGKSLPETRAAPLENLDVRLGGKVGGRGKASGERLDELQRLKQAVPGVSVEFDPITGTARWISSPEALLSLPQKKLASNEPDAPVRLFIEANRNLFGHGPEVLDQSRRITDYTPERSIARKVVWHQQLDGIDIFEAVFQANLTESSALINIGSQMIADPAAAAGEDRRQVVAAPPVSPEQAVAVAGKNVGERVTPRTVRPAGPPAAQPDRRQVFRAAMLTDAEAKLAWVPMSPTSLRLAWDVTVSTRTKAEMHRVLVDARSGEVLVRQSLTAYLGEGSYRVFTAESPTP